MMTREYQNQLVGLLQKKFNNVHNEWQAFPKAKNQYGPRVDIAIGPFNTETAPTNLTSRYNQLIKKDPFKTFLSMAYAFHSSNLDISKYEHIGASSYKEVIDKN